MPGHEDIKSRMAGRLAARRAEHQERMVDLFQEEIHQAEVPPASSVSHFLERLNAEGDA